MPRVACGRKAGCGTGNVREAGSNGGIGGWGEMKMFLGFPVLFRACSQSFPGESVRSRCSRFPAVTRMDVMLSVSIYIQQTGTLGTGLKQHEFGLDRAGNKTGNSGNGLVEGGRGDAAQIGVRIVAGIGTTARYPDPTRTITSSRLVTTEMTRIMERKI